MGVTFDLKVAVAAPFALEHNWEWDLAGLDDDYEARAAADAQLLVGISL